MQKLDSDQIFMVTRELEICVQTHKIYYEKNNNYHLNIYTIYFHKVCIMHFK